MPHLVIDYAAELAGSHDIQMLCDTMFDVMAAQETFPNPDAIKVRAISWPHYRTGQTDGDFVHATVRMLQGRDDTTKQTVSTAILAGLTRALPGVHSISVEVADMHKVSYTKTVS